MPPHESCWRWSCATVSSSSLSSSAEALPLTTEYLTTSAFARSKKPVATAAVSSNESWDPETP
eukprot:CAMPEP_0197126228 /NCGR_PEP_ID=MMETSP1390-20130617/10260_1 /TAXON_ID=38833 /ORGANISM="Micromonas sp., Strain CCMP2099" /LENGTH=62 /DNA_ID=CAMNT_0042568443 /DNA_START=47 /DNA_END=232 /DNA_ORIENTATION=-